MRYPERMLDTGLGDQTVCFGLSLGLHLLLVLWNPVMLRGSWEPPHNPLVSIDMVVETPGPAGGPAEQPKKLSLMDTLKDMLLKPKVEQIAHISPEPPTARVAAPQQPLLKERSMPKSLAMQFQPRSQAQDLASASSANPIEIKGPNAPTQMAGPTLTAKSFGGIRSKELPFQVGTDQGLTGGGAVVPIAVGSRSSKDALGYVSPTLTNRAAPRATGIRPGLGSTVSDVNSIGAGGPSTIQISGTGGTGNAPTGAPSGSVLQDRQGTGGVVSGRLFGTGRGSGVGSGMEGIPGAAADLDRQLASGAGSGRQTAKPKSVELEGPIGNRTILKKIIPQYPAWAEEQGIIGSVRIYFTVASDGTVRTNLRVTKTTGYPQLDQLGIDAIKQWRFAPSTANTDEGSQWGIITFNFSLS